MKNFAQVRVRGPLVTYVEGFAATLTAQGYKFASVSERVHLVAHLSRWMAVRVVAAEQITDYVVEQFIAERRRTYTHFRSTRALGSFVRHLRSLGVLPAASPPKSVRDETLRAYERYLVEERCVKARRRQVCMTVASEFVDGRDVGELTTADVTTFVQVNRDRPNLLSRLSGLRSVLRFLFLQGHTSANLVHVVPPASHRRLVSLPKDLGAAEVDAMLAGCDRRTTIGRRAYAVLLLMVRLGLRAGEVAALTLDDIDWQAGEFVIRGKGSTGRLPLPADVGTAIVSYLRRRGGQTHTRCLFLPSRAPRRDATSAMIQGIATRALRAVGVLSGGSHRLRHTAATQMLRCGASLTEIAQVLRHRHIDTTAIYAKVDRDGLRRVVRPWPVGHIISHEQLVTLAQPWPGGAA